MKTMIAAGIGVFAIGGLVWLLVVELQHSAGMDMSSSGYTALAVGIILTVALGVGLSVLMIRSSRRGHDEPPRFR